MKKTTKTGRPEPGDPGQVRSHEDRRTNHHVKHTDLVCIVKGGIMPSKEFDSIGLIKKEMSADDFLKEASELNVHPNFLLEHYKQMLKITEKFLEIEKRLSLLETGGQ